MATFLRKHGWLLAGVFLLLATLVAASTLHPGVELTQAQVRSSLHVKLPDSEVRHEARWSLAPREEPAPPREQDVPPPAPTLARTTSTASSPLGQGIRAVGEHTYEVPSTDVEDAFARLEELSMQARVVPSFREGTPQGFKLFAIRPGSLYEKLGLQQGDVLQRINGLPLDNPEKAMEAFARLREARHIELDLERQGAPLRKVYAVE